MHPYEISTTLRTRGKEQSIKLNYGSLYSVVESLQKHGLIAPRETVKEGRRPERTIYEITSAGRLEFVDWLAELIGTGPLEPFMSDALVEEIDVNSHLSTWVTYSDGRKVDVGQQLIREGHALPYIPGPDAKAARLKQQAHGSYDGNWVTTAV